MIEFDGSKIKATMPLITNEELETIDNNLHDIVNEFIKKTVKDKDLLISQYIIKKLEEENKQLRNNVIQIRNNNQELKSRIKCIQEKRDSYKFRYKDVCKKVEQRSEIINRLEKWLKEEKYLNGDVTMKISDVSVAILRKIKELKGEL